MSTLKLIHSDYRKQKRYGAGFFVIVFFTQGFWAVFQYRIAHFFYNLGFIGKIMKIVMLPWQKTVEMVTGISIPASAKIGHSFYIGHFGGIIFNANTIIGDDCNISQGVTIGVSGTDEKRGTPVIGNRVYIGANSVVAGPISIGNDVLIGACSLVNKSVEDESVMLGVPAILVSKNGSKGYI